MARTEYVAQVMVRLTEEDYGCLQSVALPNEPRAHTFTRALRESLMPRTCLLRYRKAPLFPHWMDWGPHSPVAADVRGQHLLRSGFEVEVVMVDPPLPLPAHPDDDNESDDDLNDDEENA